MRLDSSVPKIKPAGGGAYGGGGLSFCSVEEGASRFLRGRAGKVLALAEDSAFSAMLPAVRLPRAVSVLWEGDALPLFAMPEVSGVLAAGGKEVLQAARFFAAVRGVPCALFPAGAALDGAFSPRGEVSVNANRIRVPLSPAEVFCDCAFLRGSLSEGYARLMLSRLALFEARAVGLLCRRPFGGAGYEEAFSLSGMAGELPPEEIVRRNASVFPHTRAGGCSWGCILPFLPRGSRAAMPCPTMPPARRRRAYPMRNFVCPRGRNMPPAPCGWNGCAESCSPNCAHLPRGKTPMSARCVHTESFPRRERTYTN